MSIIAFGALIGRVCPAVQDSVRWPKGAYLLVFALGAWFGLAEVCIAETAIDSRVIQILSPTLTGLIGLIIGLLLQRRKEISDEQRLYLESRMRLWLDTARAFAEYLLSWERLMSIAELEQVGGGLSEVERERKNEYVRARSEARQGLNVCLEQAVLFFGTETLQYIEDFRRFDEKHRVSKLDDLPPLSEWRNLQQRVLHEMKIEVRRP